MATKQLRGRILEEINALEEKFLLIKGLRVKGFMSYFTCEGLMFLQRSYLFGWRRCAQMQVLSPN